MNRLLIATIGASIGLTAMSVLGAARCSAQSMDDLNLQIHGYATQSFLYSNNNNWNTTDSTGGSAAWTDVVANVTVQPQPRLRIGVQARYFLLGNYGNDFTLDWAEADYKFNERFGFRAGKVKTPVSLLNETQDIDPSMLWVLLPQSVYNIEDRNSSLAHFGGAVYGHVPLGEHFGGIEYRAFGGQRVLAPDDSNFQVVRDTGLTLPDGVTGPTFGGTLRWIMPVPGLLAGASETAGSPSGAVQAGPMTGTVNLPQYRQTYYFGKYEHKRVMLAGEYYRFQLSSLIQFPYVAGLHGSWDQRAFYVMASYKLSEKLTAGAYYSSSINVDIPVSSGRYEKDWTVSGRYDFNPYLYLKAEQHFIDGTELGYSTSNNATGLKPNSRMTLLKLGVSF